MQHEFLYEVRHIRRELLKIDRRLLVGETFQVLKKNHTLSVHGVHQRSFFQLQYTIQNTLRNFSSRDEGNFITYTKLCVERAYSFTPSIGVLIVSSGSNENNLFSLISLASASNNLSISVYICAPSSLRSKYQKYGDFYDDDGLNLSEKKHLLIDKSCEDIILILHDHIMLHDDFFNNLVNCQYWDVYSCPRFAFHPTNNRLIPAHGSFINFKGSMEGVGWRPKNSKFNGIVDYNQTFINGGFLCFRRSILKHIVWPNHLSWGAMEDIHLSRCLILGGAVFHYDQDNYFIGSSLRLGKKRFLFSSFSYLKVVKYFPNVIRNLIKYWKISFND